MAANLGLIVFCWGDENNSKETIKFLKELNIHGIIYDKMDKLSMKTEKVMNISHCFVTIIIQMIKIVYRIWKLFKSKREKSLKTYFSILKHSKQDKTIFLRDLKL